MLNPYLGKPAVKRNAAKGVTNDVQQLEQPLIF
jgi:hypothetical protein